MSNSYKSCTEHMWPRCGPSGSIRSIGKVEHEQCNNCLSIRVTFTTDLLVGKNWVRFTETKVVEPTFDMEKGVIIENND